MCLTLMDDCHHIVPLPLICSPVSADQMAMIENAALEELFSGCGFNIVAGGGGGAECL